MCTHRCKATGECHCTEGKIVQGFEYIERPEAYWGREERVYAAMRAHDNGLIQRFDAESTTQELLQEYDESVFSSANNVRDRNNIEVGAHVPVATYSKINECHLSELEWGSRNDTSHMNAHDPALQNAEWWYIEHHRMATAIHSSEERSQLVRWADT